MSSTAAAPFTGPPGSWCTSPASRAPLILCPDLIALRPRLCRIGPILDSRRQPGLSQIELSRGPPTSSWNRCPLRLVGRSQMSARL